MTSQVHDMQRLVESLVAGTERRVAGQVIRLELASVDRGERLSNIAAMSEDVAQMRADTDAAVAELSATRVQSASLLQTALLTISDIRSGWNANPEPKKSKPAAETTVEPKKSKPAADAAVEPKKSKPAADAAVEPKKSKPAAEATVEPKKSKPAAGAQDRRPTKAEIFSFIADHPSGISLVEMEEYFSTPRIVLQRPVKEMYETDHEVTRDDETGKYFAV